MEREPSKNEERWKTLENIRTEAFDPRIMLGSLWLLGTMAERRVKRAAW
jgi:hypothetical protein